MKTLLLLGCIFGNLLLTAQNLNHAEHHGIDHVGNMVAIHSNAYYFELDEYGCCSDEIRLTGVNSAGQNIFSTSLALIAGHWPSPKKLFKTLDNGLVLFGSSEVDCDVTGLKDFFIKLDTLGNIIFETDIPVPANIYQSQIVDMTQYADSSYYFVSDSMLFHCLGGGALISSISSGLKGINSITALANGHLLINGKINNALKNVEMTTSAVIVNQQASVHVVKKFIQAGNGELYAGTTIGGLEHYDASLNLLNTMSGSASVNDFIVRNDSVFATGTNSPQITPFYCILSQNLAVLYMTQQPTYLNVYPVGITINGNKVTVLTGGTSNIDTFISFKSLYQFPVLGTFVSASDVGVPHYSMNSYTCQANQTTSGYYQAFPVYDLDVTVKNYGNDTIHSFYLSSYISSIYCYYLFHKQYTNTILPHDSVVVPTGAINVGALAVSGGAQPPTVLPIDLCFFTTVPNASNDINISNDSRCDTVYLNLTITGIKQNVLTASEVKLFPNPFTSLLHIQSDVEIKRVDMYNALGVTQQQAIVNKNDVSLDNSALPAGIYFIKIETEKGSVIKKVVKQ